MYKKTRRIKYIICSALAIMSHTTSEANCDTDWCRCTIIRVVEVGFVDLLISCYVLVLQSESGSFPITSYTKHYSCNTVAIEKPTKQLPQYGVP
jgi:hypothetical protein